MQVYVGMLMLYVCRELEGPSNSAFTLAAGHRTAQYGMVRYVFGVCLH